MTSRGFVHFNANARQFKAKHPELGEEFEGDVNDVQMFGHQPIRKRMENY